MPPLTVDAAWQRFGCFSVADAEEAQRAAARVLAPGAAANRVVWWGWTERVRRVRAAARAQAAAGRSGRERLDISTTTRGCLVDDLLRSAPWSTARCSAATRRRRACKSPRRVRAICGCGWCSEAPAAPAKRRRGSRLGIKASSSTTKLDCRSGRCSGGAGAFGERARWISGCRAAGAGRETPGSVRADVQDAARCCGCVRRWTSEATRAAVANWPPAPRGACPWRASSPGSAGAFRPPPSNPAAGAARACHHPAAGTLRCYAPFQAVNGLLAPTIAYLCRARAASGTVGPPSHSEPWLAERANSRAHRAGRHRR